VKIKKIEEVYDQDIHNIRELVEMTLRMGFNVVIASPQTGDTQIVAFPGVENIIYSVQILNDVVQHVEIAKCKKVF
jgi:hypothetical protein